LIFTSNYLAEQLGAEARGTTGYAAVRPKNLLASAIPLPPLNEQRRIVARLEELSAKIEAARTLNQNSAVQSGFLIMAVGAHVFGTPDNTLGGVANVTKLAGFEYTKYLTNALPGDVIVVRAGNVRNSGLDLSCGMTISKEVSDALPRSQLKPRDVVMTFIGANIGDVTYVSDELSRLHCGPNVARVTPRDGVSHLYLVKVLQSQLVQDQIEEVTKSTAQPSLSMKTIRQLKVPIPPLAQQRRIVVYLDNLQGKVDAVQKLQEESDKELNALVPSILSRAFSGEL
jgi:type I restriction enzyme S subunit